MSGALLEAVKSSNLQAVGYHRASGTLFVQFRRSGGIWEYRNVPQGTHQAMLAADSVGQYFSRHVRNRFEGINLNDRAACEARWQVLEAFRKGLEERARAETERRQAVHSVIREAAARSGRAVVGF